MPKNLYSYFLFIFLLGATRHSGAAATRAGATVAAENQSKIHAGQEIFNSRCLQCHAVLKGQSSFGPNLNAEMARPHPRKPATEIMQILRNGKGKMPGFEDKLTAPDLEELLAYLRTL